MALRDFFYFRDDFEGCRVFTAGAVDSKGELFYTDTSAAGTPTCALVTPATEFGELKLSFDATAEVQNLCLSNNDILNIPIGRINEFRARIKQGPATLAATSMWALGLAGARNDTTDTVAQNCWFRGVGSNAIVVETDDGTTDLDDKVTGRLMTQAYHDFVINFARGSGDIRFFIDGQPVAQDVTFSMAAYTGALQVYFQLQKSANANTDNMTIDLIEVEGRRGITRLA